MKTETDKPMTAEEVLANHHVISVKTFKNRSTVYCHQETISAMEEFATLKVAEAVMEKDKRISELEEKIHLANKALTTLNFLGGLGFDKHKLIDETLLKTSCPVQG